MSQKINPTLFRLGWTKQSNNTWYSFQNSKYGTIFIQDYLWHNSLELSFLQIGFLTSDIFIKRNSNSIVINLKIFLSDNPIKNNKLSKISSTGITSSINNLSFQVPSWKVYKLCLEWQNKLEKFTGLPIYFQVEWVPTFQLNSTLMAKQFRHLIEKNMSIKRAIDTVFSSRNKSKFKKSPFVLPDTQYGNLNWWIWITFNYLKILNLRKKAFLRGHINLKSKRSYFNIRKFPINIFIKKKRYFIPWLKTPLYFLRTKNYKLFLSRKNKFPFYKILRSNRIIQYWTMYLKIWYKYLSWRREIFQRSYKNIPLYNNFMPIKDIQQYLTRNDNSTSLLQLGDYILSTQFQIQQGQFYKYKLSGRLNGVDMAQKIKNQYGSFYDPYALQVEQLDIQTSWGKYGLTVNST